MYQYNHLSPLIIWWLLLLKLVLSRNKGIFFMARVTLQRELRVSFKVGALAPNLLLEPTIPYYQRFLFSCSTTLTLRISTTSSFCLVRRKMDCFGVCMYSKNRINHFYLLQEWNIIHKLQNAANFQVLFYRAKNNTKAWVRVQEHSLLLEMKTGVESWALLSPVGTYHKLCEPNFFVGREDDMDLTLKVRLIVPNFDWKNCEIASN